MAPPRKFQPLTELLYTLPPDVPALRVPLRELEALLGSSLPRSAWTRTYWRSGAVARTNWLRVGFAAQFDRRHQTVLFTRLDGSSEQRCRATVDALATPEAAVQAGRDRALARRSAAANMAHERAPA